MAMDMKTTNTLHCPRRFANDEFCSEPLGELMLGQLTVLPNVRASTFFGGIVLTCPSCGYRYQWGVTDVGFGLNEAAQIQALLESLPHLTPFLSNVHDQATALIKRAHKRRDL